MHDNSYYLELLNNHKKTGYLFKRIFFPFGTVGELIFQIFGLYVLGSVIFINTHIIGLVFLLVYIILYIEYKLVKKYRGLIIEKAFIEEEMFRIELIQYGVDPNFPHDPLYITDEDRKGFFREALYLNKRRKLYRIIWSFFKRK